jgi:hypothetical protein
MKDIAKLYKIELDINDIKLSDKFTKEAKKVFGLLINTYKEDEDKNTKNSFNVKFSVECVGIVVQYTDDTFDVEVSESFKGEYTKEEVKQIVINDILLDNNLK